MNDKQKARDFLATRPELLDEKVKSPAVIEAYEKEHPGDTIGAQATRTAMKELRDGSGMNNGSTNGELTWRQGRRLKTIAAKHGGLDTFEQTVMLVDNIASQFGGLEALKLALAEVKKEGDEEDEAA